MSGGFENDFDFWDRLDKRRRRRSKEVEKLASELTPEQIDESERWAKRFRDSGASGYSAQRILSLISMLRSRDARIAELERQLAYCQTIMRDQFDIDEMRAALREIIPVGLHFKPNEKYIAHCRLILAALGEKAE